MVLETTLKLKQKREHLSKGVTTHKKRRWDSMQSSYQELHSLTINTETNVHGFIASCLHVTMDLGMMSLLSSTFGYQSLAMEMI
jgi:hypothetical protein